MTPTLEHLLNFGVVVLVQLIFFIVHSIAVGEGRTILKHLGQGILLGLPFGIVFDLVIGNGFTMYEYELGFTWWFLLINGVFSFGFMMANVRLLYHHTLKHMYVWSMGLAIVYEITNYFFPVWKWTFIPSTALEYAVVVLLAYAGITALMMLALKTIYRVHFRLFQF
jgi:hypothetical protein